MYSAPSGATARARGSLRRAGVRDRHSPGWRPRGAGDRRDQPVGRDLADPPLEELAEVERAVGGDRHPLKGSQQSIGGRYSLTGLASAAGERRDRSVGCDPADPPVAVVADVQRAVRPQGQGRGEVERGLGRRTPIAGEPGHSGSGHGGDHPVGVHLAHPVVVRRPGTRSRRGRRPARWPTIVASVAGPPSPPNPSWPLPAKVFDHRIDGGGTRLAAAAVVQGPGDGVVGLVDVERPSTEAAGLAVERCPARRSRSRRSSPRCVPAPRSARFRTAAKLRSRSAGIA